jgi:hypothetical protein
MLSISTVFVIGVPDTVTVSDSGRGGGVAVVDSVLKHGVTFPRGEFQSKYPLKHVIRM